MYCVTDFCCICFCNEQPFKNLSNTDNDNITYYLKLTSCVPEMCFKEINDQRLVCNKCCETMNIVYEFRQTCLRNKFRLRNCVSQLPTDGAANVLFIDIKQECQIENNMETEIEQIFLFTDVEKYHNETENSETNSEHNDINSKLTESKPSYFKIGNIKEIEDQTSEKCLESFDVSLENQEIVKIHSIENNSKLMVGEMKNESDKQDIEEHLPTTLDNILVSSDSDNEVTEYLDTCYEDVLMNQSEIKIEVVNHNIEIFDDDMNGEINIQCEDEYFEKFAKENYLIPTALDPNSCYKIMEEKPESSVSNKISKLQVHRIRNRKDKKITHMRIHTEDILHECSICKKKFTLLNNLTRHMLIHSGKKPHECNTCKKKFRQAGDLKTHIRIHTGEKPFECSVCKKKFRQQGDLKTHSGIHTGEKPYECNICKNKFRQAGNLKIHMRSHTGEKPYECVVCKKKFSQPHNLKYHMRIHTGEKPYKRSVHKSKLNRPHHL